jgi:hypothetical protein
MIHEREKSKIITNFEGGSEKRKLQLPLCILFSFPNSESQTMRDQINIPIDQDIDTHTLR